VPDVLLIVPSVPPSLPAPVPGSIRMRMRVRMSAHSTAAGALELRQTPPTYRRPWGLGEGCQKLAPLTWLIHHGDSTALLPMCSAQRRCTPMGTTLACWAMRSAAIRCRVGWAH
jgi:hypothetical protein